MKAKDAAAVWTKEAQEYDAKGDEHRAKLARYFAASAEGKPNASKLAPESMQQGLKAFDRQESLY